ncbi:hypothetical protein ACE6H2_011174 [Prunus campanulata]
MAGPVKFQRPCKAPVSVRVEGTLQALAEPEKLKSQDGWVVFQNIDGLTVSGELELATTITIGTNSD